MNFSTSTLKEDILLDGVVHSIAFCEKTQTILACDSFNWTVERFAPSLALSLTEKALTLHDQPGIRQPTSIQVADKSGIIFIGCDSGNGIHALNPNSLQLVNTFGQNLNRSFNYIVVDEGGSNDLSSFMVYGISINEGLLTKLDCGTGSIVGELLIRSPRNILLKHKLYVISEVHANPCILIIDKNSLKILNSLKIKGWSSIGGLCLDKYHHLCVTACDESMKRFIYCFNEEDELKCQILLNEIDADALVVDMLTVEEDLIILTQEPGPEFYLKTVKYLVQ